MTRKDFELIAETIREYNSLPKLQRNMTSIEQMFASKLKSTNPRFDSGRFLTACLPCPSKVVR